MCGQTFKTTLSEGRGEGKHLCDAGLFPFPVMKKYACVFGLSQLVLSGDVAQNSCLRLHFLIFRLVSIMSLSCYVFYAVSALLILLVYFWLLRSFTDPANTNVNSCFVRCPLPHIQK